MMLLVAGWVLRLLGRFHPVTIHFPIAFLLAAAGLELVGLVRKKPTLPDGTFFALGAGAAGALVSAALGWADAASLRFGSEDAVVLGVHRWLGTFTAAGASVAVVLLLGLRKGHFPKLKPLYRTLLLASTLSVGIGAHFGGILVYGHGYYSSAFAAPEPASPPPREQAAPAPPTGNGLRYDTDVRPIFQEHCVRCHGPQKQRGLLRLDSRQAVLDGGKSGPAVRAGDSAHSRLYRAVTDPDPATRMPQKAPPLPADLVDRIRTWIDQGAR